MTYVPVDLERLDETYEDLAEWEDSDAEKASEPPAEARVRARQERAAYAALYQRSGLVEASPQHPPTTSSAPRGSSRRGA